MGVHAGCSVSEQACDGRSPRGYAALDIGLADFSLRKTKRVDTQLPPGCIPIPLPPGYTRTLTPWVYQQTDQQPYPLGIPLLVLTSLANLLAVTKSVGKWMLRTDGKGQLTQVS